MHCQWQGLSTTVSNHVDRLWHLIAQRTLLGGRYTGRNVSQTSRGWRGHQLPLSTPSLSLPFNPSFPPSSPSTVHPPLLFPSLPSSSLPFLPSPPPRPLHSLPLPLEVGLLIAAIGSGSALAPPLSGSGQSPAAKRFILNYKSRL